MVHALGVDSRGLDHAPGAKTQPKVIYPIRQHISSITTSQIAMPEAFKLLGMPESMAHYMKHGHN